MTTTMTATYRSLRALAAITVLAQLVAPTAAHAGPLPVLMVIANKDFWYQEYAKVRQGLVARGIPVVVAAGSTADAIPQPSGRVEAVTPDIAVAEASASDYSAIVFVGGWGASMYQYSFEGTYDGPQYRPDSYVALAVNRLINEFIAADKPVAALSHGVTVLAWARVDGVSPLRGRTVAAWPGGGPGFTYDGQQQKGGAIPVYWHVIQNGGIARTAASVGDPLSSGDDVVVDGRIITGENPAAAPLFVKTLARAIAAR